jgi:hypothetical protein
MVAATAPGAADENAVSSPSYFHGWEKPFYRDIFAFLGLRVSDLELL